MIVMKSKLVMKKLFVCVLSVLMLVMMCGVGASAAGQSYTLTVEGLGDRIIIQVVNKKLLHYHLGLMLNKINRQNM